MHSKHLNGLKCVNLWKFTLRPFSLLTPTCFLRESGIFSCRQRDTSANISLWPLKQLWKKNHMRLGWWGRRAENPLSRLWPHSNKMVVKIIPPCCMHDVPLSACVRYSSVHWIHLVVSIYSCLCLCVFLCLLVALLWQSQKLQRRDSSTASAGVVEI